MAGPRFDADSVRDEWDRAARAYAAGQDAGRDVYRYAFFGPAQVAFCGDVRGARLLDVGCGSGYFSREMAKQGAHVTGVDISPAMIEEARAREKAAPLGIEYEAVEAERIAERFAPGSFDMVTSCLALQDMPDVPHALRAVRSVLPLGGRFIPSIMHPFADTPFRRWERDENRTKRWLCVDRYFDRGPFACTWEGWPYDFTTIALHVPLEDWIRWILDAGFQIRAFAEPKPTDETLRLHPGLEDAARMPYYIFFDLVAI